MMIKLDSIANELGLVVPDFNQQIYVDECCYSTDTPESPEGIFVNLKSFIAYGRHSLIYDNLLAQFGKMLYLNIKKIRVPKSNTTSPSTPNLDSLEALIPYRDEMSYRLVIWPQNFYISIESIDENDDPLTFQLCMSIINREGGERINSKIFMYQDKLISRYSETLYQIDNPPQLPSSGWKCNRCGSSVNLWLNLSDGYIGCGRKNYGIGGGCIDGSEGAAITHYEETGQIYPLAVKLSTITPTFAEVYSYAKDEDSFVIDTKLSQHLGHFGIKVNDMKKCELTTSEFELEYNKNYDWSGMSNGDVSLKGIGFVGFLNLGNTCYLNSALQLLLDIEDIRSYFTENYRNIANTSNSYSAHPSRDLLLQFAKIVYSYNTDFHIGKQRILLDEFLKKCAENNISCATPADYCNNYVTPRMFKNLLVYLNPDYGYPTQQDTQECLSFLLNKFESVEDQLGGRCGTPFSVSDLFKFKIRQTLICGDELNFQDNEAQMLSVSVSQRLITDIKKCSDDCDDKTIDLSECLSEWLVSETVDYFSEKTNTNSKASINLRIIECPKYLLIHVKRFYLSEDWVPKKIKLGIEIPDTLDLTPLLFDEQEVKQVLSTSNLDIIQSLEDMGFALNDIMRAIGHCSTLTIENLIQYITDNPASCNYTFKPSPADVELLTSIGIPEQHILPLLKKFENNCDAAVEWYYSQKEPGTQLQSAKKRKLNLGGYEYKLLGFITHVGNSIDCGHYVYHSKRDIGWVQFNDDKVGKCSTLPDIKSGYCYLYINTNSLNN